MIFNIKQLESLIQKKLVLSKNITFEEALQTKHTNEYIDVFKLNENSLVLYNEEIDFISGLNQLATKEVKLVEFILSDTTMTYAFRYYENKEIKNEDFYFFEENLCFQGNNILKLSENDDVINDGFSKLIDQYLGTSFFNIDLMSKAVRYIIE